MTRTTGRTILPLCLFFVATSFCSAQSFRYAEGKHGKGELKYINDLPVLRVEGKPDDIGEQVAVLATKSSGKLLAYPKDFLKLAGLESTWPAMVAAGKGLLKHFPADYLKEMDASVKAAQLDRDLLIGANTMFDIKKAFACSTLIVEPEKSVTKGMLFGRNLDFPTLGYLQDYSLVMVVRPEGKRAFVSIGFPGCLGVLSGMNDAGLTLAVLECYTANDDSKRFEPGTPYGLCCRRILEECATVAEAEKLLRSMQRTTRINLAICDPKTAAVFEITPKTVAVRGAQDGCCCCTNHFRTKELATSTECRRFEILDATRQLGKLDVPDVAKRLHLANQGNLTLQTMIFEPATLKLHLAIGKTPSSALPMKTVELANLMGKGGTPGK